MEKIITNVALFRFGVHRWERCVNAHLADGWKSKQIYVEKKLFKIICYAHLEKE